MPMDLIGEDYYEVIFNGFDPDDSSTDYLVKWVKVENKQMFKMYLRKHDVRSFRKMTRSHISFEDGLDLIL